MHGGLWGFLVIQNPNACKGSLWKPIRWQIKLWVSCCRLDGVHIGTQKHTGAAVCRLTTRNTCGRRMETMTHLLLFVAIDTGVYTFKWEHHLAATETWLFIELVQHHYRFSLFFMLNHGIGLKNEMQHAKRNGKTNIIKTQASSSLPNVATRVVPDLLTTWRTCEPAACLKLCWPG